MIQRIKKNIIINSYASFGRTWRIFCHRAPQLRKLRVQRVPVKLFDLVSLQTTWVLFRNPKNSNLVTCFLKTYHEKRQKISRRNPYVLYSPIFFPCTVVTKNFVLQNKKDALRTISHELYATKTMSVIYRSITGQLPVNYRSIIGHLSVNYRSITGQLIVS